MKCNCDACKKEVKKERQEKPLVVGEVYCHIGNSGATFSVEDEGFGPTLRVETSAFGNIRQSNRIYLDKRAIRKLRELLQKAEDFSDYTEEYCHAAALDSYNFGGTNSIYGMKSW